MNLNHVCYIGGIARAGKTIIANRFTNTNVHIIHTDDISDKSIITKEEHPFLWEMRNEGIGFAKRPLTEYIEAYMNTCKETFSLMEKQLTDLETNDIVIVEGIHLLPELLYNRGINNACFLISQQDFMDKILAEMEGFQAEVQAHDEPAIIYENIIALMKFMRIHIEEKARKYQFRIIPVDNEHDLDMNTKSVAEHFFLPFPQRI